METPADERPALHAGLGADGGEHLVDRSCPGHRRGPHGALLAQAHDEGAGVDLLQRDDALAVEPPRPVLAGRAAHDDRPRVGARGLGALRRDAVVPDHRRREGDELLGEARVGDDLLVAGHRRREDGLAVRDAERTDRAAAEDRPVLEGEEAAHAEYTSFPAATVWRTRPCSFEPRSHEFVDFDLKEPSSTCQAASRSRSTRFAGAPTVIVGGSRP